LEIIQTCHSIGFRIFEIILGIGIICVSVLVLRSAVRLKIRSIRVFGVWVVGDDASLAAGVFAAFLLLFGIVILFAAVLGLDC